MAVNLYKYLNIYYWGRKFVFSKIFNILFFISDNLKRKIIFYFIYKSNHWRSYKKPLINESVSGLGSDLNVTKKLITDLRSFIMNNSINSILDIGCGDFNWLKHLLDDNNNFRYLGVDIVEDLINTNNKFYSNSNINFICRDIINYDFPNNFDLIIIRDVFIHIKNKDIINILKKIKSNKCKFYAINNFSDVKKNIDVKDYGHHRLLNIEIDPFFLDGVFYKLKDYDRELNIYKNI